MDVRLFTVTMMLVMSHLPTSSTEDDAMTITTALISSSTGTTTTTDTTPNKNTSLTTSLSTSSSSKSSTNKPLTVTTDSSLDNNNATANDSEHLQSSSMLFITSSFTEVLSSSPDMHTTEPLDSISVASLDASAASLEILTTLPISTDTFMLSESISATSSDSIVVGSPSVLPSLSVEVSTKPVDNAASLSAHQECLDKLSEIKQDRNIILGVLLAVCMVLLLLLIAACIRLRRLGDSVMSIKKKYDINETNNL